MGFDATSQPCSRQVAATIDLEIDGKVRYIYVAVAGTITYTLQGDPDTVHSAVPFPQGWHPMRPKVISAVATMAVTDIKLCYTS